MKMTSLLNQTLRETPSRGESDGLNFLIRAGYLHPVSNSDYIHLPLGVKSIRKMQAALRQLVDPRSQEVFLPLSVNARGAVTEIIRRSIQSYRQLPRQFFSFSPLWQKSATTDPRTINHAVRCSFALYSLSSVDFEHQINEQALLLEKILNHWHLPNQVIPGEAASHLAVKSAEIIYPSELGEQTILHCPGCGYSANRRSARFFRGNPSSDVLLPVEEVHTPGTHTIQALADFLAISPSKTAKAVLLVASFADSIQAQSPPGEEFIIAMIRGDLDVDSGKLARLLGAMSLRPALEAEIRAAGAEPGFTSPIGLKDIRVVVDESIPLSANLVAGANRPDYHLLNVNYGRDFSAWKTGDIALAFEGAPCPHCQAPLSSHKGFLVGSLEQLNHITSGKQDITYLDAAGKPQSMRMESCWLDLDTVMSCIAQEHHDDKGLRMPVTVAPFTTCIVVINSKDGSSEQAAENIYRDLTDSGVEVLLDDRHERAGVKFNDADLLGLPLRITVSERRLQENMVEIKWRSAAEAEAIPVNMICQYVTAAFESQSWKIAASSQ